MYTKNLNLQAFIEKLFCSGYIETIDLSSEHSASATIPVLKQHQIDILDSILEGLDVLEPKPEAIQVTRLRRAPRRKSIPEKVSPNRLLKQTIIKRKLIKASESSDRAARRFLPDISITRMTKEQIQRLRRPWGFLEQIEIKDKYEFTGNIINRRVALDTGEAEVLVNWSPPGILEDEWMEESEFPADKMKRVNVTNFSWRQKLLIGGHIENKNEST